MMIVMMSDVGADSQEVETRSRRQMQAVMPWVPCCDVVIDGDGNGDEMVLVCTGAKEADTGGHDGSSGLSGKDYGL